MPEVCPEQLLPAARLADGESDAEWAARAGHTAASDLHRMVRTAKVPTEDEARARRRRRGVHTWWDDDTGMFRFAGAGLPDADVHAVEHPGPSYQVQVPLEGPAEICGIPLPAGVVEKPRASAKVQAVLVDEHGVERARGSAAASLPPRVRTSVLCRDAHCRYGDCDRRHGLQVHHRWPKSWGGGDDQSNLASVCVGGSTDHHADLAPHGPWLLLGNPNRVDGFRLVHREQLTELARLAGVEDVFSLNGHPIVCDPELLDSALTRIRAGPAAA